MGKDERNILGSGNNAKISFENYIVSEIVLRYLKEDEEKNIFGVTIGNDEKKEHIKLRIKITTEIRYVEIEMIGDFKFEEGITDQEKEKFLKINGASILYPYIRAYISTLTSFDKEGQALIVPTINFQNLFEEEKSEEENIIPRA